VVRRMLSGISESMPFSKAATSGSAWPGCANSAHNARRSSRVVVSSSAMPSIVSPHSRKRRRFMPCASARATISAVAAPVSRHSASKAQAFTTFTPIWRRPCARMAV